MFIHEVYLHHFRNYERLRCRFTEPYNLLLGNNGQGKTNFLEAIYYGIYLKSFRVNHFLPLIREGSSMFSIQICYEDFSLQHRLFIKRERTSMNLSLDDKPVKPEVVKKNRLKIILLNNDDVDLCSELPLRRRMYFDHILTGLRKEYGMALKEYRRIISHRNLDLKRKKPVERWDDALCKVGTLVIKARLSFLRATSLSLRHVFARLSHLKEEAMIRYDMYSVKRESVFWTQEEDQRIFDAFEEEDYLKGLRASYRLDKQYGYTHFGPHHDDFLFFIGKRFVKTKASQGEKRLFVYALKFAMFEYVRYASKRNPLLLLDDIFSDLDSQKIAYLMELIKTSSQIFLACANKHLLQAHDRLFRTYAVKEGTLVAS